MFRKIWKTIRLFLIAAVILICMPHSFLPSKGRDKENKSTRTTKNTEQPGDTLNNKASGVKPVLKP